MDNSRLFLFAALVFVGMLLWQQWQTDYGPQPTLSGEVTTSTNGVEPPPGIVIDDLPDQADQVSGSTGTSDSTISTGSEADTATTQKQQLLRVETDVIQVLIDTRGGVGGYLPLGGSALLTVRCPQTR